MKSINNKQKKYKNVTCSKCNSKRIKKDGKRITLNRGKIQRYKCKDCSYRFVKNNGFYRMRNSPNKITLCLDLFYRGISTRKIQEHLQSFYPKNSDNSTIYRWVIKYSKLISEFTDKLKVSIGQEVQIDEMEFHRRRSHKAKKGIYKDWFIDSIDTKTKYMISSAYAKSRGKKEIKQIIQNIKNKAENKIKVVTTDGFMTYVNVVKKTFGYSSKLEKYNIEHKQVTASKGEGFNHPIERLHNTIRHRTKTFRGFHGSLESAYLIMKGLEIYYNFITKHQSINCCPYELATDLELKSPNKWLALIQKGAKND